ncbi:MAG: hypothetical protein IKS20_04370, partial [Victivallales bacterium]|nr:hypothetical protein [Victivallales bacterium]
MSAEHNEKPVIGSVTAVQEAYNDNPYAIKVTVSNITDPDQGDTIESFSFSLNDGEPTVVEFANMIDNGNGSYSYYIELTSEDVGEFTVSAVVTDQGDLSSDPVSATALTIDDVTPPNEVDLGSCAEDQKLVITQEGQFVTLSWDVPYDNVGVTGYYLWFEGNPPVFTTDTNSYTTDELAVGDWHAVAIQAFDAAGNIGQEGATKFTFTVYDMTAPVPISIIPKQAVEGYQVTVDDLDDWTDNVGIDHFVFTVNDVEFDATDLGDGTYSIELDESFIGQTVEIKVTAYDEAENSAFSTANLT